MKILVNPKCCLSILLGLLLQGAVATAFSPQLNKHLDELCRALEKEIDRQVAEAPKRHGDEDPQRVRAYLTATLRAAIASNRPEQLDMILNEIQGAIKTAASRSLLAKVRAELKIEIDKQTAAAVARIDKKLAAAAKAVRDATKPADLDATLRDLTTSYQSESDSYSARIPDRSKIDSAIQFVRYWQDYLAAVESKDSKTAMQRLESASNLRADLLQRSEILNRLMELKKWKARSPAELITEVMSRTKSLDAIPVALDELSAFETDQWNSTRDYDATIAFLRGELKAISLTYNQFKSGIPTTYVLHHPNSQPNDLDPVSLTQPLRVQLLQLILPRVIGSRDVEMKSDETIQAYLDRILALASDRLDARMIVRVCELQNTLRGERQVDLTALQPLLAAQNQDTAGQFAAAVASYQTALKNGGDLIPARQIGARIEEIKTAHPTEYAAGMEEFMKSPPSYPSRSTYIAGTIVIPGNTP